MCCVLGNTNLCQSTALDVHYEHISLKTPVTLTCTIHNIIVKRLLVVVGHGGVNGDNHVMVNHQHESFWDRTGTTCHAQPRLFEPFIMDLDGPQPSQTLPHACKCNQHCSTMISEGVEETIGCHNHAILTMKA